MAADSLCIGDICCLYSEEAYGFVFSLQSSSIHSELAVSSKQDRQKPPIPDPQVISFKLCVANRYKLNKKCRKLRAKLENNPNDPELRSQLSQAMIGARAENEDNISEQTRQMGKRVQYGQVIQLQHLFTNKYIHVSTTQTSETESSNMQVMLMEFNAKQAQFRIMPRYKVKAEGDVVQVEDQIILESVKSAGQYLHVSKPTFDKLSVYSECNEMNLSVRQSGFTVYRRYKPDKQQEELLKALSNSDDFNRDKHLLKLRAGVPIRLFHKEIEAYLCVEGLFDDAVTEDVHLRIRPVDQNNPKSLFPSSSAITYWMVEMQEGPINGGVLRWEQQCRFKHLGTRMYLMIDAVKKRVSLTKEHTDPATVFRLHPVIKEKDEIEFETFCRIEHVVTNCWLHASSEEYLRTQNAGQEENDMSMAGLRWTTAHLKQVIATDEMQYDDAFTLQQVEIEHTDVFNYMAGMVPFIQKVIKEKRGGMQLTAKITQDICSALSEMKKWMIVMGLPQKNRQKLLRNLRVVELLVSMLQVPIRGSKDQSYMTKILVECYDVLYTYLMGDSRKNELYIAKHIDFFESQIRFEGDIGLNAAHMVMELVKDNRKIVDRITRTHIDNFVALLHHNKNYHYLDLLSVLCVCDGVSIPDNQKYITEAWLINTKNCVYHTELGQAIGKDSNVVYLSVDNRRTWKALHEFVKGRDLDNDTEFLFLDHQLDLFGKVCYGRNEYSIDVITQKLGFLTWEEAFLCLTNHQLPDQLRAKYCYLIIGLFVDVGENTSVLDNINLTFIYDEIGSVGQSSEAKANAQPNQAPKDKNKAVRERSLTSKYFPQLSDWISKFLDDNKDMTASLIGHNMLVEQVLRLVHFLVRYGYYGEMDDIQNLLGPLLGLLDGRNDKPFPKSSGVSNIDVNNYQRSERYKQSQETSAIVNAKFQAMEVLDLFFNFRFNVRLERFVELFKTTYNTIHHNVDVHHRPELEILLYEEFDIYENPSTNSYAIKKLKDVFALTSYFGHLPIKEILLDLSHYDYDKMVTQSMALLDRFYSGFDNLFKRAVQAQVLITEKSSQVLSELRQLLPVVHRMTTAKMTTEQTEVMSEILDKFTKYCHLDNEPDEPHPMNQSILYNHDILSTIFDILSQEIDIRLMGQYSGIQAIFQKCFLLLKAMARGNPEVQRRLFDRLDMLLTIEGAEAEMAEALTEVFTGNKDNCMKVLPYQVQRVMFIVSQKTSKATQFLDLLNAIVKVEELNLPLKRNQGYVMKYFMQYRSEVGIVIDQSPEGRQKLLTGNTCPELEYLISLVDMLATCAEGENRFIESICQTIFSSDELLDTINNPSIENNMKTPYLRFLLWVYLNTAGGMIESGQGDLNHDKRIWTYFIKLTEEIQTLTDYIATHKEMVKQLLKKRPPKSDGTEQEIYLPLDDPVQLNDLLSEHGYGDYRTHHGTLHYLFEAAMPFMQIFFKAYYQPDTENHPNEADIVDKLATILMAYIDTVGPLMSNGTHVQTMVSCMNVVLSSSTLPVKVMETFQEKYGRANQKELDIRSDARKSYEDYYKAEEDLNEQLNIFAINYSAAYGGINTVRAQIDFPSEEPYTDIGGNEELPLGEEFQEHMACFIGESRKDSGMMGLGLGLSLMMVTKKASKTNYSLCGKLVQQLSISASQTQMSEKERLTQEHLDIKCFQLLRGIIYNEIIKLPPDWEGDPKGNKKQLEKIIEVQDSLNEHQALLKVLGHLSKTGDALVKEVLAFIATMLFGGNPSVQQSLIEYFLGTREEKFFFAIKNRMQLSAIATKEKRSLLAQHQAKMEEAIEQARALAKAMKTGKIAAEEIMAANQKFGSNLHSRVTLGASRKAGLSGQHDQTPLSGISINTFTSPGPVKSAALKSRYGSKSYMGSTASMNRSRGNLSRMGASNILTAVYGENGSAGMEMTPMDRKMGKIPDDKQKLLGNKDNKISPMPNENAGAEDDEVSKAEVDAIIAAAGLGGDDAPIDTKDEGFIELVLKILGLMCDGQNTTLQDYLREQPDNIKSVNLVAETAKFLQLLYSAISNETIALVIELFKTLVEFCSGNAQNQVTVFDSKVCDYINFILRSANFHGCEEGDILELKMSIGILINAMTEENMPEAKDHTHGSKPLAIARDVMDSLDADSLEGVMQECYLKAVMQPSDRKNKVSSEHQETYMSVGFLYYMIMARMNDLIPEENIWERVRVTTSINEEEDGEYDNNLGVDTIACRQFYQEGTLSVEVIKDDAIQKVYFRCKNKAVLRQNVKELFKYEVDRSSPSNKLRELMDWSKDIMEDIKYTRKVMRNPLLRFFARFWWYFNMAMMGTSFLFFLFIMVFWRANVDFTVAKPNYAYSETAAIIITYTLGAIHNICTLFVFISYVVTNHPVLPNVRAWFRRRRADFIEDEMEEEARTSNLEVRAFSFQTIFYFLMLVFSILGTVFWGYFFCFHLLHMANFNQLLRRAIQAVTKNGLSLSWVFVYSLVFIYIFALVSFAAFRDVYAEGQDQHCTTMYECFVTVFHRGLIVGTYEFLEVPMGKTFEFTVAKAAFDIVFFIIITTIGLNIIFGIIVDTFSELRDGKWQVDQDMHSTCFICSRNAYDFEHQGGGFENHVKKEHNQWAYLFFFIHLDETRPNDYTSIELYVSRRLEKEKYDFFPLNRALSLQHEEDSNEVRLETLMSQVSYLVNRMKEEESEKQKEIEKKRQIEWEQEHKNLKK